MANLKIYTGNVTSGAKDGTGVSLEHSMSNPIAVELDASRSESKYVKCAVRCDSGFKTSGVTTISFMYWDGTQYQPIGGTVDKYKVALDNNYTESSVSGAQWQDSLVINDEIDDTNTVFWVKISSTPDEVPATYTDVALTAKGSVVAV